jgi:hypothetical protein
MAQSLHSFIANTMHSLEDVGVRMLINYCICVSFENS